MDEKDGLEEFEELEPTTTQQTSSGGSGARKPDMRVVQPTYDQNGQLVYKSVGGMWKNVSKNGNEFYVLRIGELKLLVFPNKMEGD